MLADTGARLHETEGGFEGVTRDGKAICAAMDHGKIMVQVGGEAGPARQGFPTGESLRGTC